VTTWVVPGRPIGGDGIVLKLPGLRVTPERAQVANGQLPLAAHVTLMCGCPITRGGHWDAADYEVHGVIEQGDKTVGDVPLTFTGETNRFAGSLPAPPSGRYQVTVWAHNAKTGNTGVGRATVDVP
jgi:hypothetical protein